MRMENKNAKITAKNAAAKLTATDIARIAGEAGAKAALDIVIKKTGNIQAAAANSAYKAAERRLWALPVIKKKIEHDRERLKEYERDIEIGASKSIVRFNTTGSRIDAIDKLEALKQNIAAGIAADEYEIKLVEDALKIIEDDPYYKAVYNKYILRENDDCIAAQIHCDPSTVYRNRSRLIRQFAIRLYGVKAL